MKAILSFFIVFALLFPAAFSAEQPEKSLFVYCAAGMRKPVESLSQAFEAEKGVKIDLTYDGSNKLLGQIKLTRKGDVYIAGDADYIDMAKKEGLAGEPRTLCWFVPVIMVRKGNPKGIAALPDCAKKGIKIGQADDKAAAVGRIMPKLLALNGVDSTAWRNNVAMTTPTVNELGMAVKLGTIDAAVVWSAVANNYKEAADQVAIPAAKNVTPEVGAALLSFSKMKETAREYLDYLTSEKAKAALKKDGYIIEKPAQ
jgi:molybdate transport system substrate-binding protein